jgi:hypothetical protein
VERQQRRQQLLQVVDVVLPSLDQLSVVSLGMVVDVVVVDVLLSVERLQEELLDFYQRCQLSIQVVCTPLLHS